MPDDPPPSPAPRDLDIPLASWVKGGTTSLGYDLAQAEQDADAERRRAIQAAQFRSAKTGELPAALSPDGRAIDANSRAMARVSSLQLGGRKTHACVVLGLRHPKDNSILDWITCELSTEIDEYGKEVLILHMCCPRCIYSRNTHPQNAQIRIHQNNRMFYLDSRTEEQGGKAGMLWANPADPNEVITLAGTITTNDWITCPNLGCGWKFKIDDSIVRSM
jgi:hypothetical protein